MIERIGKDVVINGDIRPLADYYDGVEDQDEIIFVDSERVAQSLPDIAPEVASVLALLAARVQELSSKINSSGEHVYSQQDAERIAHRELNIGMRAARLMARGIDAAPLLRNTTDSEGTIAESQSSTEDEVHSREPDWRERQVGKDW